MKTTALIALLALAGCTPRPAADEVRLPDRRGSMAEVVEITLNDGVTKCAVYRGYKAGGISCNWPR